MCVLGLVEGQVVCCVEEGYAYNAREPCKASGKHGNGGGVLRQERSMGEAGEQEG